MAAPKVFVSSTCYDLNVLRGELRGFISSLGYEPFMSDYSDLLFDPRQHTHASCVQEVGACDMLVLIVGKRFGGTATPDAIAMLDFTAIEALIRTKDVSTLKEKLSITQLEVLKAIELKVPVFVFVDAGVMNDHLTYERNKGKLIISQIDFPNVEKQETAKYIFEFINYLRLRSTGNALISFTRLEDIREHLRRQWAALFQRMLFEDRNRQQEARRFDTLSSQIAGLQAAVLGSISSSELKETARGAIQFRRFIDLIATLHREEKNPRLILLEDITWDELLKRLEIEKVIRFPISGFGQYVILLTDGTYFRSRFPLSSMAEKWGEFKSKTRSTREAVIDAVLEGRDYASSFPMVRYFNEQFKESELLNIGISEEEAAEHQQNVLRNNATE